jgi:hypothetical protein
VALLVNREWPDCGGKPLLYVGMSERMAPLKDKSLGFMQFNWRLGNCLEISQV